jgi:hypothetical protein
LLKRHNVNNPEELLGVYCFGRSEGNDEQKKER